MFYTQLVMLKQSFLMRKASILFVFFLNHMLFVYLSLLNIYRISFPIPQKVSILCLLLKITFDIFMSVI